MGSGGKKAYCTKNASVFERLKPRFQMVSCYIYNYFGGE